MWEEHPKYQKQQARLIGLIFAGVVVLYAIYAIAHRDWDLLRGVFVFAGVVGMAFGLLLGFVWLAAKMLTRKRTQGTKIEDGHDGGGPALDR